MDELTTYIGTRKIDRIEGAKVYFENGDSEEYSEKSLEYLISKEPVNDSELQNIQANNVLREVFDVLRSHNIRMQDMGFMWSKIQNSLDMFQDKVFCKAAGLSDKYDGNTAIQMRNIRIKHLENFLGQDVDNNS